MLVVAGMRDWLGSARSDRSGVSDEPRFCFASEIQEPASRQSVLPSVVPRGSDHRLRETLALMGTGAVF
jgi:hypothetical protein